MTLQEILKSQGLNDEQIQKVLGEMKQNKILRQVKKTLTSGIPNLKQTMTP